MQGLWLNSVKEWVSSGQLWLTGDVCVWWTLKTQGYPYYQEAVDPHPQVRTIYPRGYSCPKWKWQDFECVCCYLPPSWDGLTDACSEEVGMLFVSPCTVKARQISWERPEAAAVRDADTHTHAHGASDTVLSGCVLLRSSKQYSTQELGSEDGCWWDNAPDSSWPQPGSRNIGPITAQWIQKQTQKISLIIYPCSSSTQERGVYIVTKKCGEIFCKYVWSWLGIGLCKCVNNVYCN